MEVSIEVPPARWMVYSEKSQSKMDDDIRGTPMTQETSKYGERDVMSLKNGRLVAGRRLIFLVYMLVGIYYMELSVIEDISKYS